MSVKAAAVLRLWPMEVTGVEVDDVSSNEGARRGEVSAEWGMARERRLRLRCGWGGD